MTNSGILVVAAVAATLAAGSARAQQNEHRFTVTNGTDVDIEYFYFASCGAGAWGKDRLGAKEVIKPGTRKQFGIRAAGNDDCCHDLRAKLQTGASRQKLNADVCRDPEWVVH